MRVLAGPSPHLNHEESGVLDRRRLWVLELLAHRLHFHLLGKKKTFFLWQKSIDAYFCVMDESQEIPSEARGVESFEVLIRESD